MDQTEGLWEARPKTPNFGNIEKGGFFYAMQIGIRPKADKVDEGNNASTKLGFFIEMAADGFVVFKNDVISGYLGQSDPDIIEFDIQSISKIFEGLVITVSFGKLAAIIGNKKSRAMADPAWNLLKLVNSSWRLCCALLLQSLAPVRYAGLPRSGRSLARTVRGRVVANRPETWTWIISTSWKPSTLLSTNAPRPRH